MNKLGTDAVLAVDGGGSGCRLALITGSERFETRSGPCNVSTDLAGALAAIRHGLTSLADAAGLEPGELADIPAYFALAGVVGPDDAERVAASLPFSNVQIDSDQPSTAEGALGQRDGALAGLGTGSFFGLKSGDNLKLAGGWGSRIDDRASGFWLGQQALRAALEAYDGRAQSNAVSEAVFDQFGSPAGIVAFSLDAGPEEIARLSRIVTDAASDPVASSILENGAVHVLGAVTAIGWDRSLPLCAIGGVAEAYRPFFERRATLIEASGTALEGALARAQRFAEGRL